MGLACARLGVALNLKDRAWADRSATAVIVALRDPATQQDDYIRLAETLAAVNENLSPTQAADYAAQALDVFLTILREKHTYLIKYDPFGRAIATISPWLDVDAATRAAEALGAGLRQAASYPTAWEPLAKALAAVCRRLPPPSAAAHVNLTVDWILESRAATNEMQKVYYRYHALALRPFCDRLDAARATRVADAVLATLGDSENLGNLKTEYISDIASAEVLTAVVELLDAPSNLRATEELVRALRKSESLILNSEPLRIALVAVCRRLDAAGAARMSDAVIAAVRDPKTSVGVRTILAHVLAALDRQLAPAQTDSLESAIVDSLLAGLADAKSLYFGAQLGRALESVCERPGAKAHPRRRRPDRGDPQPTNSDRVTQAAGGGTCGGQRASAPEGSHFPCEPGRCRTRRPLELQDEAPRPFVPRRGAALLWARLTPAESAAHAKRATADIAHGFRDPKATPDELRELVYALIAVCRHLGPTERDAPTNTAVDAFLHALQKNKHELLIVNRLWGTLADLCPHLDRPGVARVTNALFAALDDHKMQLYLFVFHDGMLTKFAACLNEAELQQLLERPIAVALLQRVILDVLGRSKNRSFRNTWDYLDWIEANGNGVAPPRALR